MMNREWIAINGLKTAHAIVGDGEPVLMLHGWGASIDLLSPLAERLALSKFCCLMLDLPGFGESESPSEGWSVHEYVQFVLAYMEAQKINKFHLFGHSFGGRLGLVLGAKHSGCIKRMVLADSAGIHAQPSYSTQIRLRFYRAIRDGLNFVGLSQLSVLLQQAYNQRYGSADFQSAAGAMRETFIRVVNEDLREYAKHVQVETLLLWGDRDEDTPLWQAKELENLIPNAGLVVYEGAGHYSYLDRLNEVVQVIDYFFKL